jgi:hypothetical protein
MEFVVAAEEAAEKVGKADPSRTKSPLGMTKMNGLYGAAEAAPLRKPAGSESFRSL